MTAEKKTELKIINLNIAGRFSGWAFDVSQLWQFPL